jgi:predicted GNAT family N-acyltransferase
VLVVRVEIVSDEWPGFPTLLDLSYEVLYRDFGVSRDADWYHLAPGSIFAVALDENRELVGSARLLPDLGDGTRQIRQVAVTPSWRGLGAGRALMLALEGEARAHGSAEAWLYARDTAYGFYECLGYTPAGDEFMSALTGIAHREMRKRLLP